MDRYAEEIKRIIDNAETEQEMIEKEFLEHYPTIVDGKTKKYAIYNGRYCSSMEQIPMEDRYLFNAGLRNSSQEALPNALYYEVDNVRRTTGDDMERVPEFAQQFNRYIRLEELAKQLKEALKKYLLMEKAELQERAAKDREDLDLLHKYFHSVDLGSTYYEASNNGRDTYIKNKSVEQLSHEKDELYKMAASINVSIQKRSELLQAIDRVYGKYIEMEQSRLETETRSR